MNGSIPGAVRSVSTDLDATTIAIIALSFLLFVLFLLVMVAIIRMSNAICDIRDIMRKHYVASEVPKQPIQKDSANEEQIIEKQS